MRPPFGLGRELVGVLGGEIELVKLRSGGTTLTQRVIRIHSPEDVTGDA